MAVIEQCLTYERHRTVVELSAHSGIFALHFMEGLEDVQALCKVGATYVR